MLKAKIHMATVTESNLEYEGSITIDEQLLREAGILPYELVMVSNLNNGERLNLCNSRRTRERKDMSQRTHREKGSGG